MRCTAGLHEGAASVSLDRWQGTWHFLPNEFVESALNASSRLPIQHLDLKHHRLGSLPANLALPDTLLPFSLTTLDISFNCFVLLPPVMCQLIKLRELYLNNNQLSHLTEEMSNLKELEVLHLQCNQLRTLPVCLCGLVSLKRLNLESNRIETIPPEISKLKNLKELYLRSNSIEHFPDAFTQLSNLEELHLTNNVLKHLPNHLEGLSSLKQLHLANNKLRFLPLSIINLSMLQGLTLSGNPLKFPPLSACREGVKGLRAFMVERYCSSSHEWGSISITDNLYYDSDGSGSDTPYEDIEPALKQ